MICQEHDNVPWEITRNLSQSQGYRITQVHDICLFVFGCCSAAPSKSSWLEKTMQETTRRNRIRIWDIQDELETEAHRTTQANTASRIAWQCKPGHQKNCRVAQSQRDRIAQADHNVTRDIRRNWLCGKSQGDRNIQAHDSAPRDIIRNYLLFNHKVIG